MKIDQRKVSSDRDELIRRLEKAMQQDSEAMKLKYKPRCINNSFHNIAITIKYESAGDTQITNINNPEGDLEKNAWITMNKS